jgi:hypothetical protein
MWYYGPIITGGPRIEGSLEGYVDRVRTVRSFRSFPYRYRMYICTGGAAPLLLPSEATVWLPKLLSVLDFGIGCFLPLLGVGPGPCTQWASPHRWAGRYLPIMCVSALTPAPWRACEVRVWLGQTLLFSFHRGSRRSLCLAADTAARWAILLA